MDSHFACSIYIFEPENIIPRYPIGIFRIVRHLKTLLPVAFGDVVFCCHSQMLSMISSVYVLW